MPPKKANDDEQLFTQAGVKCSGTSAEILDSVGFDTSRILI